MRRRLFFLSVLAALLLAVLVIAPSAAQPAAAAAPMPPTYLLADMVTLDRAYIAALAVTSLEKLEPSQKSMAILVPTWAAFQAKYIGSNPADPQWRPDFDAVNDMIGRADEIVRANSGLVAAHDELEDVRITLMGLRERNGLTYYVDHLTRFHEPMEAIVLAAKGKTPQTLSAADLDVIQSHLPAARSIWADVTAAPFDAALFGFAPEKQAAMQKQLSAESAALSQLQAALDAGDTPAIIQRAVALKPAFSVLFMLFGDFDVLS